MNKPALVQVHGNDYYARMDGTSHYADPNDSRTYCGKLAGRLLLEVCPWDIEPNCPTCNMAYKMREAKHVKDGHAVAEGVEL